MATTTSPKAGERTQHTPGPWTATPTSTTTGAWFAIAPEYDLERVITDTDCFATNRTSDAVTIEEVPEAFTDTDDGAEVRANARLIAAAPDLLDALRSVMSNADLSRNDWPEDTMAVLRNALIAIAKATE